MIRESYTFGDLLLVPQYSEITSRSQVDTSVSFTSYNWKHPIIPANMKSIIGLSNIDSMIENQGLSIMHRYWGINEQIKLICTLTSQKFQVDPMNHLGFSIGVQKNDYANVEKLISNGVKIICIDVAHGDSELTLNMIKHVKKLFSSYPVNDGIIIAGNIATRSAAQRLWSAGANFVKVGIGGGSICTTRVMTGNGIPQMTALMDVHEEVEINNNHGWYEQPIGIISDGGITSSGDIVKALCYADMVMVGNLFAGAFDGPGDIENIDGKNYKRYDGSSTHKNTYIEGVKSLVPLKLKFGEILEDLLQGVRSGCSYQGVSNVTALQDNPEFVRISHAGQKESASHDVMTLVEQS